MQRRSRGRGYKNPWETATMRVPIPLFPLFRELIDEFVESGGKIPDFPSPQANCLLTRQEAERLGQDLIRQRKSLKNALPILLDAIFGELPPPPADLHHPRREPCTSTTGDPDSSTGSGTGQEECPQ